MKFARTVCGDIQAEEMGFTYPHEHLYAVPPTCQKDRDLEVSDYEGSVAELKLFKSVGGQTLVEASTLDYGRNLSLLKKMSEETGVHVIATTGFNKHIYYPNWVEEKSTEEISDILADDILEGRDGIRAGFIKIGTYYNMIHPLEEKTAVAAGTGAEKVWSADLGTYRSRNNGNGIVRYSCSGKCRFFHCCFRAFRSKSG